jgi:hypothetical protein
MNSKSKCVYASFKSDRERLLALISRDLRMVAVSVACAAATGGSAVMDVFTRWL